ncbi:MAG: ATP-binding protein, partial [Bacteroides sp.]
NSKAPFFTCQNLSLMNGVLCAYDADPYAASYLAGKRASAILKGGNPRDFGFSRTVSNFMYDYKQLDFFRVDVDKATPGMVINQPYWEKYQLLFILLYASVLALLVCVVVWLARINRREAKRRMHAQTRLLLQNRLVAQRDEFDHVFHSIRDGVITYDTDLRIHFTNHAMQKILHLNKEDLSRPFEGMPAGATIRLYNNGKEVLCELLRQVLDEGIGITIPENSFMQEVHSNDYFLVSGEIVPICLHGKVSGVAFSFRNVSDEEVQRRFFNLAIEESSVYPWQYNVHTGVFTFSQNFLKEIGFSEEHKMLSHQDMMELLHPDDLHAVRELFDKIIAGDSLNTRISFRQRNVQGEYEWWEYRVSVLNGPTQDMPYDVLGVCQNIQRYKSTEQALTAARDKALQADKLKTAFLANMSHEIRTPLNAIVGFSDLLTDMKNFTEEEVGQFIVTINKNCTLLLTLINDILDLSRIESGSMDFRFAPHNLLLLLKNVYDSQCLNMPEGVELLLDVPTDEKKYITTDAVRLQQVINNLINNAAKFTTSGSITFGYKIDAPGTVTLFVEDTGKGISDEAIRHIFERFYKADSFTQGAGLGLSICQTIVERLHGTIGVTSEVNVGTRFSVKIADECV